MKKYNKDEYYPLDGKIIEACDQLAAFIEATKSINHGITSNHLEEGRKSILEKYGSKKIGQLNLKDIYKDFKLNEE